ncbi:hypothetical protein F0L74_12410 [Chitinophaga agrisoli]|uniref:Uncharacterized protein n=1 Tax=Chitinophaga agrisoli TaxID=2607653 RepID=A0A5B2VWZ9_9BACT|nr:hypothetical protein [Chitinophaga agrisoli]KAA2243304.1 hypothetical protein F0L74_12410 [Chitinophaga agrisoli]
MRTHLAIYLFLTVFAGIGYMPTVLAQTPMLVEAEDFQFKGGWQAERAAGMQASNDSILRVFSGKAAPAFTVIAVKTAGNYTVWVRAVDYPANKPGTRLFRVAVNEQPVEQEAGRHGKEGYYWEKIGSTILTAGENVLTLEDTRGNFGRCDAIFLAKDNVDPNAQPVAELRRYKLKPLTAPYTPPAPPPFAGPAAIPSTARVVAAISNERLRLQFVQNANGIFARSAVKAAAHNTANQWIPIAGGSEGNRVFLLSAVKPQIGFGSFFPSWNGTRSYGSFLSRGKKFAVLAPESLRNPFLAGTLKACRPIAVKQASANKLSVTYQTTDGDTLQGTWQLNAGASHLQLTLTYTPQQTGYYSLVVSAFNELPLDKVTNIQLPPMFQYQRIPAQPILLPSAMMPQPLAMAEVKQGNGVMTSFISGTPASFPLDWAQAYTSPMGFTIKNERNQVQPVSCSPILGLNDSQVQAGQSLTRHFALGILAANWNDALEYISDSIYRVKDYRTQAVSLTETAFNITDLIRNDTAAGWDPVLKGFYDIEADPTQLITVVQAAPLALVSAAVLAHDESFYTSRALPAIEYTLSRNGFRWGYQRFVAGHAVNKKVALLSPFNTQFTTAYYEGLDQLLGRANPWLKQVALPGDKIRLANGYSVQIPEWTQELAAYRLTKDQHWLDATVRDAAAYITRAVYGAQTTPLSKQPFYNASFYAYWWDLLDLYDLTKDPRFLQAAETTAFHTLAGVRVYPAIKDTLQTIHPGNAYEGNTSVWWKGALHYRLGFPRHEGDVREQQVPESLVSPVGLGFEQPYTFFDPGKLVRHVFMSNWAPHLLRLYSYDHRKIFETYARNAIIGRFTNYPGYYATGFTNITMQPDFPYKGPDVSSIYYHHIPPHLAFTLDYLVTEAIQRSGGNVYFPYGKQDGFVWFNNRVFGGGTGTIMGDSTVHLWMKKGLLTIDNPALNYVTAVGDDRFWLILLNESSGQSAAHIQMGAETPVKDNTPATVYATDKKQVPMQQRQLAVTLPAHGYTVISFPLAAKTANKPIPPVKNGMQVLQLGAGIGKCYVFRIRSPFGWDSIYGYLESQPAGALQCTVLVNNTETTVTSYPYEWSVHPLNAQEAVTVKVKLRTDSGETDEGTVVFDGAQ